MMATGNTLQQVVDRADVNVEPHVYLSDLKLTCLENDKLAVCHSENCESSSNSALRIYGLRPRGRRKTSRYSPDSISRGGKKGHTGVDNKSSSSEAATFERAPDNEHYIKLPQDPEDAEVIQFAGGFGKQGYQRRDSGRFGGRLKANPLRNLAATFQTKLSHGSYCNLLELATEIHLEAKEKHNTTMRRIYDVVNVTEAVGCVERYVISRCGKKLKQSSKGSPLSGSLVRWCNSPATDGNSKDVVERLRNNLYEKEELFKSLAEEVELLESLMRHRQVKSTSAECSPTLIRDSQTSESLEDVEQFSNQPIAASTSHGISVPFCILKTSKESDDTNFEICTYTDEFGKEYQVALSSDHQFQPFQWKWVVKEMLNSSGCEFSYDC